MIRSGNVNVWVATTPVDMRKSFDSLAEHVRVFLGHDPLCGSMFVFRNRAAPHAPHRSLRLCASARCPVVSRAEPLGRGGLAHLLATDH